MTRPRAVVLSSYDHCPLPPRSGGPGVHLLESPPLVSGLAQQHSLMGLAAQLSATRAGLADAEAALAVTRHRAELAEQQLGVG